MKNKTQKLFTFLFIGCIAMTINGCGAANTPQTNTPPAAEQTVDDSQPTSEQAAGTAEAETQALTDTQAPADTSTPAETADSAVAAPISGETLSIAGIITDATKYSVTVQTPEGETFFLTIPESGVTGNLDYLTIGQIATLSYIGSLDENHASLVEISDSSISTDIYVEEYAFAIKIINAVRDMNMEALSDLTNFPVFIDTGDYSGPMNSSGEFEAINNEKIFTEPLLDRLVNYNLFDLEYTDSGFVMGRGTPSITFDVDDDGILGIIGINSAAPKQ